MAGGNINIILTFGLIILSVFWLVTDPRSLKERLLYLLRPVVLFSQLIAILIILLHLLYPRIITINLGELSKEVTSVGLFVYFTGFIITIFAKINMGKNWGLPAQLDQKRQDLVIRGLYRYSRNPMYVGFLLVALGYFLTFNSYFVLIPVVLFYLLNKAVKKEEELLERHFGKKYLEYKSKVPRFL